ncbi:MAG: type II toxin-antitoxin system HicA family toxin [Bacteroidia bacterium]|nr:type II toxin-antitoxin system HicA family toxin [Bacteroidia bacterium]
MKTMTGKHLCDILESKGWLLVRITGSHHIFVKPGSVLRISVPVHGNKDLKTGLLKSILKMADINEIDL